jgi:hypothetical protein
MLENVCLPRLGVAKTILNELAPNGGINVDLVCLIVLVIVSCFISHPLCRTTSSAKCCSQWR